MLLFKTINYTLTSVSISSPHCLYVEVHITHRSCVYFVTAAGAAAAAATVWEADVPHWAAEAGRDESAPAEGAAGAARIHNAAFRSGHTHTHPSKRNDTPHISLGTLTPFLECSKPHSHVVSLRSSHLWDYRYFHAPFFRPVHAQPDDARWRKCPADGPSTPWSSQWDVWVLFYC